MAIRIEIENWDVVRARFARAPGKLRKAIKATMEATLLKLWQSIPPYPRQRPESSYIRTGSLGRSLGSGFSGGVGGGRPDIYKVTQSHNRIEGEFGTKLKYAPYVIGERTQANVHKGVGSLTPWWTLDGTVIRKAARPIFKLWVAMIRELAAFLNRGAG